MSFAAANLEHARRRASDGRATVLFVDDEPRVLNSMRIMFRRNYRVLLAEGGQSALETIRREPVDVIVADHRMPGMTGVELLSDVKETSPETVRILLTGYADLSAIEGSINDGEVFRFLTKPCPAAELRTTVALAVDIAEQGSVGLRTVPSSPEKASASSDTPGPSLHRKSQQDTNGVLVFTSDTQLAGLAREALASEFAVHHAGNLVGVVEALEADRPGVLITDVSEDREVIEQMTMNLKKHLPELVTIVASEFSDSADLIRLINCGQVFRYIRKPVTPGRLRVSVKAAVTHHQRLLDDPAAARRHLVDAPADTARVSEGLAASVMTRILGLRRAWFS